MSTERADIPPTTEEVAVAPVAAEPTPAEPTEAPAAPQAATPAASTEATATIVADAGVAAAAATPSGEEKRKRSRSRSGARLHHTEGGAAEADHHQKHARHEDKTTSKPQALSAAAKKESELSQDTCVRFGIFEPRREISKEEFMDEMEAIRMMGAVEQIVLEPFTPGQDQYFWARIYFNSAENADIAATELNIPLRKSKWRLSVTQRLPLKGAGSGEMGTIPAFQPFVCEPVDTVVVDTQEGYVAFSTDELYLSRSATEFIDAKRNGRLIRRLICKHFDAERRIPCRYGVGCSFMHIKATAVNRLLRTVGHRAPLRFTKQEEDIQVGTWEYERRHDTLLVRHLDADMTQKELSYMFANCEGFLHCSVFANKDDKNNARLGARYGLVRFSNKATAMATLLQTYDSNLSISFFGVMEDVRRMQMHNVKEQRLLPATFDSSQQTHVLFSPITNQVIGLADRQNRGNFNNHNNYNNQNNNNNNNNRYNNNNNGGNSYGNNNNDRYSNSTNFNNHQRYNNNSNNNNNFNNNNNGGRYNQGRPHDYGNDRYNNNSNGVYQAPDAQGSSNSGNNNGQQQQGPLFAAPNRDGGNTNSGSSNNAGGNPAPDAPVPFPPLPSGWGYGVSRRNGKYYFFEHGSKAPTTFKHPVTGDKYGGN